MKHEWREKLYGKTYDILNKDSKSDQKGSFIRANCDPEEAVYLNDQFRGYNDHSFDHGSLPSHTLPKLRKRIGEVTDMIPHGLYGFVGAGLVGFHDDVDTSIDREDSVVFMMPLYMKENRLKCNTASERESFEEDYFLRGWNGKIERHIMRKGGLIIFDAKVNHAIMTNKSYWLLCGLLKRPV